MEMAMVTDRVLVVYENHRSYPLKVLSDNVIVNIFCQHLISADVCVLTKNTVNLRIILNKLELIYESCQPLAFYRACLD